MAQTVHSVSSPGVRDEWGASCSCGGTHRQVERRPSFNHPGVPMKKLLVSAGVAGLLLAGAGSAIAAAPDGTFKYKDNGNLPQDCFAAGAAQITQNGQFVSGQGDSEIDQTTTPGSRADAVHGAQTCRGQS